MTRAQALPPADWPLWTDRQKTVYLERLRGRNNSVGGSAYDQFKRQYRPDPLAFVHDCFKWPEGQSPTFYQDEIVAAVPVEKRVAAMGPHGLGKSALMAWLTIWFALTNDGDDWKALQTASVWRQLDKFLWPEIRKWVRLLDWEKIGRGEFTGRELFAQKLVLKTGEAFPVASNDHEKIEGAHANRMLYQFDESKAIPDNTWNAAEGAFTGGGLDGNVAFAVACSTPGEPQGSFYRIMTKKRGYDDWWVRKVTREECIRAGRMDREWAEQRREQWGEESAVYRNRVCGEFATSDEDGVIPLPWVEAANERWYAWKDAGKPGKFIGVGVDVADSPEVSPNRLGQTTKSTDSVRAATVYAKRYGVAIDTLVSRRGEDPVKTAERTEAIVKREGGYAVVDGIGVGSGTVATLRKSRIPVISFIASAKSFRRDRSGDLTFADKRSEAWWNAREMLDPRFDPVIALPPDEELTADLTSPKWEPQADGRIKVESKSQIVHRLHRSTDYGDATVMILNEDESNVGRTFGFGSVMEAVTNEVEPLFEEQVERLDAMGILEPEEPLFTNADRGDEI
jgi:hypothetical protein